MKKLLGIFATIVLVMSLFSSPAFAAKPQTITLEYNQTQYQWRGLDEFGGWTFEYQNSPVSANYTLKGNTLHTSWDYSPLVSNLTGESTVYVYDKKSGYWKEKEGTVCYVYEPGYGEYPVVNYFRGYIEFDDEPSADSFVHGVAYQWVYLYAPEDGDLEGSYTEYAVWDETMEAWLVGFSIYLWDTGTQSYSQSFPDPFIEPVPASKYNPLDL